MLVFSTFIAVLLAIGIALEIAVRLLGPVGFIVVLLIIVFMIGAETGRKTGA